MAAGEPKRDRVQELRDRLTDIANNDTRAVEAADRWADFSKEELEGFLLMPSSDFPMHGFASKREVRIALAGYRTKKEAPFGLVAAHERVGYFIRKEEQQKSPGVVGVVVIPGAPAAVAALPDRPVVVMRRDARGQLEEVRREGVIDVKEGGDGP